jgi:hypothetical protein
VEDSERFVLSFWYKRLTPPADWPIISR